MVMMSDETLALHTAMHQIFQQNLFRSRLNTVLVQVNGLQSCSNPRFNRRVKLHQEICPGIYSFHSPSDVLRTSPMNITSHHSTYSLCNTKFVLSFIMNISP
ncbi:hypothetical protein C0J52_22344 [Blattella germanica]|nr:hypothetical protein C0J52_22344 [Blattella germanica]